MVSKTMLLTFGSIITLVALTVIQGFLIFNTYELKKKNYSVEARDQIARVYSSPEIDSLLWKYRKDFLDQLESYEKGEINKGEVLERLKQKVKIINVDFLKIYNKKIKEEGNYYNVRIKVNASDIGIDDGSGKPDMLLSSEKDKPIFLLGDDFKENKGMIINNSTWQMGNTFVKNNKKVDMNIEFKTYIFMSIKNWQQTIIKELSGILIISIILFVFVISLLSYSINNLIKQKRLSEIKSDFINNITHELKTPLATLSLATKTLTSKHAEGQVEITNEAIAVIDRQNIRMQNLIDQVLNNSLGYNEIEIHKISFETIPFLSDIVKDFSMILNENVVIHTNFAKSSELLFADKFYLSSVIINLLNNAVKYDGTIINLNYEFNTNENKHHISIKDNGIGIAKKHQKLIFEKFYRVSEKDTHNYKGLGLGLYYCNQIIKAHKGDLLVSSKENEGSTFTIKIPKA